MDDHSLEDLLVHDETDLDMAHIIANWTSNPHLPEPIGVIYCVDRPTYNQDMVDQINSAKEKKGKGSVQGLLNAGDTWVVD
jgi:2-oxoglutarate ferredoxin oxidoreductase subunit beta